MPDKRTLGTGYLVGTGITLTSVLFIRLFASGLLGSASGLETVSGVFLSLCLAYAGLWLDRTDLENTRIWTIAQWSAAGLAILMALSLALLLSTRFPTGSTGGSTLLTNVAAGGVAGVLVGTVTELRDEQQRTAELNRRNLVLNRVLRHNIRNETNIILGYADNLAEDLDGDHANDAQLIRGKARNVARLGKKARQIEQALATDRERFAVNVEALATEAIESLRTDHPEVTLTTSIPDAVWVRADNMLSVVIENLLENAAEHSSEHVEIDLVVEETDDTVRIVVSDTGPGIPPQEMKSLETEETELDHGSGLGLRLVQWLVDHYDGWIEFAERKPRGTVVTIGLPRTTPPDSPVG